MATPLDIRAELGQCGYLPELLIRDITLSNATKVPLAAFARRPADSRSSCIAVIDGRGNSRESVRNCKELGSPIVFAYTDFEYQIWKQGATEITLLNTISQDSIHQYIIEHKDELAPTALYRAKAWGRFDKSYQLSFVDSGLLPIVESEAGVKLTGLFESLVSVNARNLKKNEIISRRDAERLLKTNFWLLAAKLLSDKRVPSFANIEKEDIHTIYRTVANHYGASDIIEPSSNELHMLKQSAERVFNFGSLEVVSTEVLSHIYENALVTPDTRKEYGTHSTPSFLVEYIVQRIRPWVEDMPLNQRHVFEPACGHGAFLISALRLLKDLLPTEITIPKQHEYLKNRLHGVDIDSFAVHEIARLSLTLADIPNPDGWDLRVADMFDWREMSDQIERADIILSNPPFEKFTRNDRLLEKGDNENYQRHLVKAGELLRIVTHNMKSGAVFGFVLPLSILNGDHSIDLRKYIINHFELSTITLLPDRVFSASGNESAVIIGRKVSDMPINSYIHYTRIREKELNRFRREPLSTSGRDIPHYMVAEINESIMFVPELWDVWDELKDCDRLELVADVGQGATLRGQKHLERGTVLVSQRPRPGFMKAFLRFGRETMTHGLPEAHWVNEDPAHIAVQRHGMPPGAPQVLVNYARSSRSPWRLKALIDGEGVYVSSRFVAVRPRANSWSIHALWAFINSPLANAYVYDHSITRENSVSLLRKLPIPKYHKELDDQLVSSVQEYISLASRVESRPLEGKLRELHWKIDELVIRQYKLSKHSESELLKLFTDAPRRGVPFEQKEYFPRYFDECITLSQLVNITYRWFDMNRRRGELINKRITEKLDSTEQAEFEELQKLAYCKRALFEDLPSNEIDDILAVCDHLRL